eukprot:2960214-Amphidinium_carterae.2
MYALYAALDMYAGRRRVLLQGAVSELVTATHGMPRGRGHAVDLLHAFLLKTLKSAGRHVSVRKYVDDMVLVAPGPCFAGHLCYGYRQVHKSLTKANIKVNKKIKKTVVICNGANAKRLLMKVWRGGRLPPPRVTTRDLGVDTQWAAWRCPVQRKRVFNFKQSMNRVRSRGLPATSKARIVKSLFSVGLYGAEVGGMSASHMNDVRISARKALGKGANLRRSSSLELMAYGGPAEDPQRLRLPADRLAWTTAVGGWYCEDQYFTWSEADYKVKWDSARALLAEVATKRPDFGGLETGLSTQSLRHLKRNANRTEDSFRSALNAALGGVCHAVWHEVRANSAFHVGKLYSL